MSSKLCVVLALVVAGCAGDPTDAAVEAIVGGTADPGGYPSHGSSVRVATNCSGTLIAPNWVLTAAHCTSTDFIRYWASEGDAPRAAETGWRQV